VSDESLGARPVRVAVDLLGGDTAPDAVVDGALLAAESGGDLTVVLVGPPETARVLLGSRGRADALDVVPATETVGMGEDPVHGVRAKRDATVRVAGRLVRDGQADAMVSAGSTGAAIVASVFTLGRLTGVSRPSLAVTVPAGDGVVVLADAGANVDCTPEMLTQFALCAAAYAQVCLGVAEPRIGLLSNGVEPGKGDSAHRAAAELLTSLPVRFVGNVESDAVTSGAVADVVVADGFSGNVLLKGLEAMLRLTRRRLLERLPNPIDAVAALDDLSPERHGGAVVLGVKGVVVVGHGASDAQSIASCVRLAARAARDRVVPRMEAAMAELAAGAQAAAGLTVVPTQQ
jgi:glycerol-3-phosphate acyltransferase PlsX